MDGRRAPGHPDPTAPPAGADRWWRGGRPVSTRRLILAALVCGLAILLAGAVFFVQVARERGAPPPGSGPETSTSTIR